MEQSPSSLSVAAHSVRTVLLSFQSHVSALQRKRLFCLTRLILELEAFCFGLVSRQGNTSLFLLCYCSHFLLLQADKVYIPERQQEPTARPG